MSEYYDNLNLDINTYCKYFRQYIMKITLEQFSKQIEKIFNEYVSPSTLSSFENGRSTNIKYLSYYYRMLDNENKINFKRALPL